MKRTRVSNSTTEGEYIVSVSFTSQIIWIQNQLKDYAISMNKIVLYCASECAIRICHNPIER